MEIRGYVSGFRTRMEQTGPTVYVTVWDFRLERVDESGQPLPRVPVAIRGLTFDGAINDDDLIEVEGAWHEGETLNVTKAHNLTTAANVVGHGARGAAGAMGGVARFILTILGLATLAVLVYLAYLVLTGYLKIF